MPVVETGNSTVIHPNADLAATAQVGSYEDLYEHSIRDPEGFWGDIAHELTWYQPWERVVDASDAPFL